MYGRFDDVEKKDADMHARYADILCGSPIAMSKEAAAILAVGERLGFELDRIAKILHSRM